MIDPDILAITRRSLHAVAEHVLGAASYRYRHRIGLRQAVGGFATQEYPFDRDGRPVLRRVLVSGTEVAARDDDLAGGTAEVRAPITSLAAAAALVGSEAGMPEGVYPLEPAPDPEEVLVVDAEAAAFLAATNAVAQAALLAFTTEHVADDPAEIQLWPEHFDLATTMAEVNYGCSAGDDGHPWPYLYVGPWSPPAQGGFWNEPFGASLSLEDVPLVGEVLEFFARGRVADR